MMKKNGGANIKVMEMMTDIRAHVRDYADKDEVEAYLTRSIDKEYRSEKIGMEADRGEVTLLTLDELFLS